jgi:two-component system sensor histidine kinase and response regulator WspE
MSGDLSGFSMFDLFRAEAESHAQALSDGLLELESQPDRAANVDPLMRAAHSIKGAARIVNLDPLVQLAHAMEDCFVAVGQGAETLTSERVDQLLRGVDLFQAISQLSEKELPDWLDAHQATCRDLAAAVREPIAAASVAPENVPGSAPATQSPPAAAHENAAGEPPSPTGSPTPSAAAPIQPERAQPETAQPETAEAERAQPEPDAAEQAVAAAPADSDAGDSEPSAAESLPTRATVAQIARELAAEDRAVPVSAANLNRILRLASESMIESRRLQAVDGSLSQLREFSREIFKLLDAADPGSPDALPRDTKSIQRLQQCWEESLQTHAQALETALWQSERTSTALYHEVLGSRMRPFTEGTVAFPRMVRDLSRKLGKRISFQVQGGAVAVDRDILRQLEAPLNHLLRNCVDHGVESPEERRQSGKPDSGQVVLSARHHAGMLTVEVRDDGRGIDPETLRRKVVERQLAAADLAADLSDDELFEFLFLPGFSTAGTVTEVSGRGVGLDVVQSMVQEVSGSIRVASKPGAGTKFTLRLPVTLSVLRAALAEIAGDLYAFPLSRLKRILRVDREACRTVQGRQQLLLDGQPIGLISAAEILGMNHSAAIDGEISVIVLGEDERQFGLVVDQFVDEQDLVVRQLDPRLGRIPHISSAAITEAGDPLLIVDVDDLIRSMHQRLAEGHLHGIRALRPAEERRPRRILVVDDSLTVREVERQLLESHGYAVDVAVDGRDGWNALSTGDYRMLVTDIDMPRMNGIELIRAVRGDRRLAELPVIVVSYKDREEDRLLGLEAGANAYLTKGSFHDDSFIGTVTDLMEDPA